MYNWNVINITVIQRTLAIISGEDISARIRLINSWQYVSRDTLWMGNGIGQTPIITNVYAYILSDFGLIGFIGKLTFTAYISFKNWKFGIVFLLLNFAKGGYLSSGYWFMMIIFITYGLSKKDHYSLKNK